MKIDVGAIVGTRCIIKDDGQKIFDMIYPFLNKGEEVVLNFSGVTQFASPFFNFAIGQLLRDISEESLRRLLHIENLNEVGQKVVERVFESSSQYHKNVDYRKIVDAILEQQAKEDN